MIPIRDHAPLPPPHDPIHREREPRPDRHHPPPERVLIARFDDEVRVVAQQRVVHEAELGAVAPGGERAFKSADQRLRSQG